MWCPDARSARRARPVPFPAICPFIGLWRKRSSHHRQRRCANFLDIAIKTMVLYRCGTQTPHTCSTSMIHKPSNGGPKSRAYGAKGSGLLRPLPSPSRPRCVARDWRIPTVAAHCRRCNSQTTVHRCGSVVQDSDGRTASDAETDPCRPRECSPQIFREARRGTRSAAGLRRDLPGSLGWRTDRCECLAYR